MNLPTVAKTTILLACFLVQISSAVSPNRVAHLSAEQFHLLDKEVIEFYEENYEDLDSKNVSYDEQLFKSLRSIRHTVVINHNDFRYTGEDFKLAAMGSSVDRDKCRHQMSQLVRLALKADGPDAGAPLSLVDFLESSARTESGVLNGNFVWLGSHSSCERARIPARVAAAYLGESGSGQHQTGGQADIRGRYCVAHLRAKSWPKRDVYFEDRLTIRKGVCIPEPCHTAIYERDAQIQQLVDRFARHNLLRPFNQDDRYETSSLYCFPDEDSAHRKWDLGAQLFAVYMALWLALTIWANVAYQRRTDLAQKLRQTVDIRMIIDESLGGSSGEEEDGQREAFGAQKGEQDKKARASGDPRQELASKLDSLTPASSDLEETDVEFVNLFRGHRKESSASWARKTKAGTNFDHHEQRQPMGSSERLDLARAFSIEANFNFLMSPRRQMMSSESDAIESPPPPPPPPPRQEKLIKDLQRKHSGVAIVSRSELGRQQQQRALGQRRVNIEILDGLKVIATGYIVFGHTLMFFFGCVSDLKFASERMLDTTMTATINTLQVVSLFYLITGCLFTYLSFSQTGPKQLLSPLFWLAVMLRRYFRLLPAYMLVFWFARHLAPHFGSGRDWYDYRTDLEYPRGFCGQESWWVMWTMSTADVKIPMDCVPQAWYLSDDFRTLLLLPAYVFLLAKSVGLGYGAIFATLAYSNMSLVSSLRSANVDYKILPAWKPHVYSLLVDRLHHVYTSFSVRIGTYLMGVIVGHLLYLYETKRIGEIPKPLGQFGMKLALAMGFIFYFGSSFIANPYFNQLLPSRDSLDSDTVALLVPIFKVAMELCLSTIMLLLVTGGGFKFIRHFLSSSSMKILSNISYAVFLSHVEVMYKLPSFKFESNYWYLFIYAVFFIACSHLVAFMLHLFYEMPINNIIRHLFRRVFGLTKS